MLHALCLKSVRFSAVQCVLAVVERSNYTQLEAERNKTRDVKARKEQMARELDELRKKFGDCLLEVEKGAATQNLTTNETAMVQHVNETIDMVRVA